MAKPPFLPKLAVLLLLPTVLVPTLPGAAYASCFGTTYEYGGKYSTNSWLGLAGSISTDSATIGSSNNHVLNYVDMSNYQYGSDCTTYQFSSGQTPQCWIQTGNGLGVTGNPDGVGEECDNVSTVEAYAEINDDNAYDCFAYTPAQISLAQEDLYEVYSTGSMSTYDGPNGEEPITLDDAYVDSNDGYQLTAQAWVPGNGSATIFGYTEFGQPNINNSCPSLGGPEYFGSTTVLEHYTTSYTWTPWTEASGTTVDAPLTTTPDPPTSVDSFEVSG